MLKPITTKILLSVFFSFWISAAYAATNLPKNCERVGYAFDADKLVFQADQEDRKQRLYLMKNISLNNLELKHSNKKSFMDLGWESSMSSDKWSALVIEYEDVPVQYEAIHRPHSGKERSDTA